MRDGIKELPGKVDFRRMPDDLHPVLVERGILDLETVAQAAEAHFQRFLDELMPLVEGGVSAYTSVLLAMATRAQAFQSRRNSYGASRRSFSHTR